MNDDQGEGFEDYDYYNLAEPDDIVYHYSEILNAEEIKTLTSAIRDVHISLNSRFKNSGFKNTSKEQMEAVGFAIEYWLGDVSCSGLDKEDLVFPS